MNTHEIICVAKVLSISMGWTDKNIITKLEIDIAADALKKQADNIWYWTEEQRNFYKSLVEAVSELSKNSI